MNPYHHQAKEIQKYLDRLFAPEDEVLENVKKEMQKRGFQPISVTPLIGKTLYFLSRLINAKKILEIGTLGGYSAIWLARSLPENGKLITIEADPKHTALARSNIQHGGLEGVVEVCQGKGLEVMQGMVEKNEKFDLIFLDADKPFYPDYIEPMIQLTRTDGLIIADNLIRRGKVLNPLPHDAHANALARFNKTICEHPRLESIMIATLVGYIGGDLDGLSVSRVL
jgi:predicted O-methyltransferase YrrM